MKYRCKTVSLVKLNVDHKGFITSLCDNCKTADCDNPIEKRSISILGIKKENKVYIRSNEPSFVVACEGFIP
jgi:hypothetical protein